MSGIFVDNELNMDKVLSFIRANDDKAQLHLIANLISLFRGRTFPLNCPIGSNFTFCLFGDTIYRDDPNILRQWGTFYLDRKVNMVVIGLVDGILAPNDEIVLMTNASDGKIYAFDGEDLHVVAPYLERLLTHGLEYPSRDSYCYGEAFSFLSRNDWEEVKSGFVGQELANQHHDFVMEYQSSFCGALKRKRSLEPQVDEPTPKRQKMS